MCDFDFRKYEDKIFFPNIILNLQFQVYLSQYFMLQAMCVLRRYVCQDQTKVSLFRAVSSSSRPHTCDKGQCIKSFCPIFTNEPVIFPPHTYLTTHREGCRCCCCCGCVVAAAFVTAAVTNAVAGGEKTGSTKSPSQIRKAPISRAPAISRKLPPHQNCRHKKGE